MMRSKEGSSVKRIVIGLLFLVAVICMMLLVNLWYEGERKDQEDDLLKPTKLSAWVVDWSLQNGMQDATAIADQLASLHWFAVYFDEQDGLTFGPDDGVGYEQFEQLVRQREMTSYLTVVNDVWLSDGRAVQKDADLISRIVTLPSSRESHIDDLLTMLAITGADGLELDYERIDAADWDGMVALIDELSQKLQTMDKKLRVILEPRAPIERLHLPEGPEYVMMAYNLYGSHSGPGPKADHEFLQQLAARMDHVPGEAIIALSLGGFSWSSDGKVKSLTEQQVESLAMQHGAQSVRDKDSHALYYSFVDDDGVQQIVWYADHITIEAWIQTLRSAGVHHIALWRLGQLGDGMIRYVSSMEKDELAN